MRKFKFGSAVLVTLILVGCGGGGDVPAKPKFAAQISFGDSLSDVGSYQVGAIAASGGGQFTINAASAVKATTPTNWTEFTSLSLNLGMPCAAQTGLDDGSNNPATGTYVMPPVDHAGCNDYAQGGSRVTLQPGIGNKASGAGNFALTVPVATQIQNFLTAHGGNFSGNEIVTVMAGANDVFYHAGLVGATLEAPASAVQAVQTTATELAADVNTQIVAKGAKYVVVMNVPDIGSTPYIALSASPAATKSLIDTLVSAFNAQLKASLPDSAYVLNVDAFTASHDEVATPVIYNLSNATPPACNIAALPGKSSLFCKSSTLTYTDPHYLFADAVHPTPYGHMLFATYVLQAMTNKGWY